jgi:hypothetical protein
MNYSHLEMKMSKQTLQVGLLQLALFFALGFVKAPAAAQSVLCPDAPPKAISYLLSAPQKDAKSGEKLLVSLTVKNVSEQVVPFWVENAADQGGLHYQFEVRDSQGEIAPEGHFTKSMRGVTDQQYRTSETPVSRSGGCVELRPGESRSYTMEITRLSDIRIPGKYTIALVDRKNNVIKSNTVAINIGPVR